MHARTALLLGILLSSHASAWELHPVALHEQHVAVVQTTEHAPQQDRSAVDLVKKHSVPDIAQDIEPLTEGHCNILSWEDE